MRSVSYRLEDFDNKKNIVIPLGFVGENEFTRINIDCHSIFKDHPNAVATSVVTPPKGDEYPGTVTRDGDIVKWIPTASDLIYDGYGKLQLTFTDGEQIGKTYNVRTHIEPSAAGSGEVPTPIQNWINQANGKLAQAEAATQAANAAAGEIDGMTVEASGTAYGNQPTATVSEVNNHKHIAFTIPAGQPGQNGQDGSDGKDGKDGKDGQDGHTPVIAGSKVGKTSTITADGVTIATIRDGNDGDPTTLIDDTAGEGQTGKTWSADKLDSEFGDVLNTIQGIHQIPSGGSSGQVLGKASGTDYDLEWKTVSGSGTVDGSLNVESTNPVQNKDIAQNIVERAVLSTAVGTFDSSTGQEKASSDRERTKNYIDENATKLILSNKTNANPSGILIYAWDSSDNYIGFWGGSGFVKSGSQYLETVDLNYFRTNYPTYKFKAVCARANDTSQKITAIYENSISSRISKIETLKNTNLSWMQNYKNGAFSVDENGTITITSSTTRVYTDGNIPDSVKTIACLNGYCFLLYAMNQNGKTYGAYKESGTFTIGGTSKLLTQFDVSKYDFYGYRIVIRKTDGTANITPEEAKNNIILLPITTEKSTEEGTADIFSDVDHNMCLCGIKKDLSDEQIPYNRGYLFHKFASADDNKLWYGNSLGNMKEVCSFPYDPRDLHFAISPTDGRIIATRRDNRSGLWIYDGQQHYRLNQFSTNPMGWLYNSGVDFIKDNSDNEYCIFAEYNGDTTPDMVFNVWRGTYPYTSESDWEIVLSQTRQQITHFHMIRRDPWTNIIYCTSGDASDECQWWYSTDCGANWTLLTSGQTSGFEDHICRCINFVFTEDYVYWATDKGTNHCLNKAERDQNGIIDPSTRVKVCDLPSGYATNFLCYVESPNGLFMYDRVDVGYTSQYGDPVALKFYDLNDNTLKDVITMPLASNTWGGCRGKCYIDYTNSVQPFPAMGFCPNSPCIFDIVADDLDNIGTIIFDPACKRFYTATLE